MFTIFKDNLGQFRWRLRAANGQIIATSGEGYWRRDDCEHGIQLVKASAPTASINDETKPRAARGW